MTGNFTVESRLMRERYLERMVEQANSLKDALKLADSAYWRCDPKHHVEGETYVQLTRLLQVQNHSFITIAIFPIEIKH